MPDNVKIMTVYSANVSGVWEVSGQGGGFCRVPRSSWGDCIKKLEEHNIRWSQTGFSNRHTLDVTANLLTHS